MKLIQLIAAFEVILEGFTILAGPVSVRTSLQISGHCWNITL